MAKKFQDIFFINAAWLLTGDGEIYINGGEKEAKTGTSPATTVENLLRMNEVLAASNKGLVESDKTMADMQKSLLKETRSILRRLEKGDAATVVSIADAG